VLDWIKNHTEKEALILSNIRTTASIYLTAERRGVMEGRASYIEDDILRDALLIMDDIEEFYNNPSLEILKKYDIKYVIFAPNGGLGGAKHN